MVIIIIEIIIIAVGIHTLLTEKHRCHDVSSLLVRLAYCSGKCVNRSLLRVIAIWRYLTVDKDCRFTHPCANSFELCVRAAFLHFHSKIERE